MRKNCIKDGVGTLEKQKGINEKVSPLATITILHIKETLRTGMRSPQKWCGTDRKEG